MRGSYVLVIGVGCAVCVAIVGAWIVLAPTLLGAVSGVLR